MSETKNVTLKPTPLAKIHAELETEWPGESIYFFDNKGQPNNDGWRSIELWSRRKSASNNSELFCCIICGLNHSHNICPGCNMPATTEGT